MMPRNLAIVILFVVAVASLPAAAVFVRIDEPVPVDRLVNNVGAYVEAHPNDATGHYTLGRIHSLAYAKLAYGQERPETVNIIPPEKLQREDAPKVELPGFAPYDSVQVGRRYEQPPTPSPEAGEHLEQSLTHYAEAVRLDPKQSLYWLSYGWMLEQSARYGDASTQPAKRSSTRPALLDQAAEAYRKSVALALPEEREGYLSAGDVPITREAAQNLLRLLRADGVTDDERAEVAELEEAIQTINRVPQAITPILFSLNGEPLAELLAPKARVTFDLAADGLGREWPWVSPKAALLVWDPNGTGRITSGTQLIGGRTWSMFWRDGYAALAALDDDGDGQLRGDELTGLAAWHDHDGDGQSDPGEVRPLASYGVTALNCSGESHGRTDIAAWQPSGVTFDDGRTLPTWDWQPTTH